MNNDFGKFVKLITINLSLFLGFIFIIFGVGEIYLRLTQDVQVGKSKNTKQRTLNKEQLAQQKKWEGNIWPSRYDSQMGRIVFKPNSKLARTNDLDYWTIEYTNSHGLLDREYKFDELGRKIAFVGDSFVQAVEVTNEKKSHVILEGMLNQAYPDENFKTYAYGYSGTGQVNQLPFYDYMIKKLKPEIVVLVLVGNDFTNNSSILESLRLGWHPEHQPRLTVLRDENNNFFFKLPEEDFAKNMLYDQQRKSGTQYYKFMYTHSAFYKYIATALSAKYPQLFFLTGINAPKDHVNFIRKLKELGYGEYVEGFENINMHVFDFSFNDKTLNKGHIDAIEKTDYVLQEWKKRAKQDKFELIALISHDVGRCDKASLYKARFIELLDANQILYVDQCKTIEKAGATFSDATFRFDMHWNEQGHKWAAESIFPLIQTIINTEQ